MLYVIASRDTAWNFIFIPVTKNEVSGEGFTYNICNLCQIIKLKLFFIVNYVMYHLCKRKNCYNKYHFHKYFCIYIIIFDYLLLYVMCQLYIYLLLYIFDFLYIYCKYYFVLYLINMHIYSKSKYFAFCFLYFIDIFNTFNNNLTTNITLSLFI